MSLQITVRGRAERELPAEVATVSLAIEVQGSDRIFVMEEASSAHREVTSALAEYVTENSVVRWSADGVRVLAQRRWLPDGQRGELEQVARLSVQAQFVDFEVLSAFVEQFSADERIELGSVSWGLSEANQKVVSGEVRAQAVADAVDKAQGYADAVHAGRVTATHLADPGMLTDPEPMMRQFAMATSDSIGGGLELVPEPIKVSCEVDARFLAG